MVRLPDFFKPNSSWYWTQIILAQVNAAAELNTPKFDIHSPNVKSAKICCWILRIPQTSCDTIRRTFSDCFRSFEKLGDRLQTKLLLQQSLQGHEELTPSRRRSGGHQQPLLRWSNASFTRPQQFEEAEFQSLSPSRIQVPLQERSGLQMYLEMYSYSPYSVVCDFDCCLVIHFG